MSKPIINKIPAFDCINDYTVTFTCDGFQPYFNELFIYENSNLLVPVYQEKIATMQNIHTIHAESATTDSHLVESINKNTFATSVSYIKGNYTFEYTESGWEYDGTIVNLNNYGITLIDGASVGDSFTVTYYPPSGLENGKQYQAVIKCYNSSQTIQTSLSDGRWFYCFSTPLFTLKDVPDESTISGSSLTVELDYYQAEDEELYSFQFNLYNSSKQIIKSSERYYSLLKNNTYTYKMLEDNGVYYIGAVGTTVNGTPLSVMKKITVNFNIPVAYSIIRAEESTDYNNIGTGIVNYETDLRTIKPDEDDFIYIDDNFIDLRNNTIKYQNGFVIDDDYTIIIKFQNGHIGNIVKMLSGSNLTSIDCIEIGDDIHCRYKLTTYSTLGVEYILYTNEQIIDDEHITLWITRKNSLYDIYVLREGEM